MDFVEGGNQGDEGNNIDLIKSCQPPPAFTSPPVPLGSFGEGGEGDLRRPLSEFKGDLRCPLSPKKGISLRDSFLLFNLYTGPIKFCENKYLVKNSFN